MKVSFTGTRQGMSDWQKQQLKYLFKEYGGKISMLVHGGCRGADVEAHEIARQVLEKNLYVACLPSTAKTSRVPEDCQFVGPPKPPSERDKDVVDLGRDLLIAAPLQMCEVLRSGTWATVRYARKKKVRVEIMWRDT